MVLPYQYKSLEETLKTFYDDSAGALHRRVSAAVNSTAGEHGMQVKD